MLTKRRNKKILKKLTNYKVSMGKLYADKNEEMLTNSLEIYVVYRALSDSKKASAASRQYGFNKSSALIVRNFFKRNPGLLNGNEEQRINYLINNKNFEELAIRLRDLVRHRTQIMANYRHKKYLLRDEIKEYISSIKDKVDMSTYELCMIAFNGSSVVSVMSRIIDGKLTEAEAKEKLDKWNIEANLRRRNKQPKSGTKIAADGVDEPVTMAADG